MVRYASPQCCGNDVHREEILVFPIPPWMNLQTYKDALIAKENQWRSEKEKIQDGEYSVGQKNIKKQQPQTKQKTLHKPLILENSRN